MDLSTFDGSEFNELFNTPVPIESDPVPPLIDETEFNFLGHELASFDDAMVSYPYPRTPVLIFTGPPSLSHNERQFLLGIYDAYSEYLAENHNRTMHALNGNTMSAVEMKWREKQLLRLAEVAANNDAEFIAFSIENDEVCDVTFAMQNLHLITARAHEILPHFTRYKEAPMKAHVPKGVALEICKVEEKARHDERGIATAKWKKREEKRKAWKVLNTVKDKEQFFDRKMSVQLKRELVDENPIYRQMLIQSTYVKKVRSKPARHEAMPDDILIGYNDTQMLEELKSDSRDLDEFTNTEILQEPKPISMHVTFERETQPEIDQINLKAEQLRETVLLKNEERQSFFNPYSDSDDEIEFDAYADRDSSPDELEAKSKLLEEKSQSWKGKFEKLLQAATNGQAQFNFHEASRLLVLLYQLYYSRNALDTAAAVYNYASIYPDIKTNAVKTLAATGIFESLRRVFTVKRPAHTEGWFRDMGVLDLMKDMKTFLTISVDSAASICIRKIVVSLAALHCFEKETALQIYAWFGKAEGMSMLGLVQVLLDCVARLLNIADLVTEGVPLTKALFMDDPVACASEECRELLAYKDRLYSGLSQEGYMDRVVWATRANAVIAFYEVLRQRVNHLKREGKEINDNYFALLKAFSEVHAEMIADGRNAPFNIFVTGRPGEGKSQLINGLFMIHAEVVKRRFNRGMVYKRVFVDKYWSNYKMYEQPYIHLPEVGALHRDIAKHMGDPVLSEVLAVCDNQPYPPPMPFEDKGKVFCIPDMCVMDGNDERANIDVVFNAPGAVHRRWKQLRMKVKPEYRKTGSEFLFDPKKAFDGSRYYDKWHFNLIEMVPTGNTKVDPIDILGPNGEKWMDYDALHDVLFVMIKEHILRETKNNQAQMAARDEVYGLVHNPLTDTELLQLAKNAPLAEITEPSARQLAFLRATKPKVAKTEADPDTMSKVRLWWESLHPGSIPSWFKQVFCSAGGCVAGFGLLATIAVAEWYIGENVGPQLVSSSVMVFILMLLLWAFRSSPYAIVIILLLFFMIRWVWKTYLTQAMLAQERARTVLVVKDKFDQLSYYLDFGTKNILEFGGKHRVLIAALVASSLGIGAILAIRSFLNGTDPEEEVLTVHFKPNRPARSQGGDKDDTEEIEAETDEKALSRIERVIGSGIPFVKVGNAAIKKQSWNTLHVDVAKHTSDAKSLWEKYTRNTRFVELIVPGPKLVHTYSYVFGVLSSYAIVNTHALLNFKDELLVYVYPHGATKDFTGPRVLSRLRRMDVVDLGEDLHLIRLSGVLFKDATPHFTTERPEVAPGLISGKPITLVAMKRDVETIDDLVGPGVLHNPLSYFYPGHIAGMCGIPIIGQFSRGFSIVGIHSAGEQDGNPLAYASYINPGRVFEAIAEFKNNSPLIPVASESLKNLPELEMPIHKSAFCHESLCGVEYFGKLPGPVLANLKSKLTKTPLHREALKEFDECMEQELGFVRQKEFLPPLMKSIRKDGEYINPFNINLKKMSKGKPALDRTILEKVVMELVERITSGLESRGVTLIAPLSLETAINGSPENEYIRRVKASTAAGVGWKGSKAKYIPLEDGVRVPVAELRAKVREKLEMWMGGTTANIIFKANLKDEPRESKKVSEGKTRLFGGAPIDGLLASRMLLQPFYALMIEHGDLFGSAVGTDMHSEAEKVYLNLVEFGKHIMEGDYKQYDTDMLFDIGWAAASVVYHVCARLGYSEHALTVLTGVLTDGLFPWFECLGDLFRTCGIQPSGKPGTAEDNCLRGVIMLMYAWYKMGHTESFFSGVRPTTYGDDLLAAVKELFETTFNNCTYAAFIKEAYDMDYTSAAKDGTLTEFVDPSNMTFLKRTFVYSPSMGRIVAPLDPESLMRSLLWYLPSKEVSAECQLRDTITSFLIELMFHASKDQHDRVRQFLIKKHTSYFGVGPEYTNLIPSYDVLLERMRGASTNEKDTHAASNAAFEWSPQNRPKFDLTDESVGVSE